MKILLISNGFPPRQWAGTETYTAGIALELAKRGNQVQVLCGGDWEEGPHYWNGYAEEYYHELPVRRLNLNWAKAPDPFGYLYNNPIVSEFLATFIDEWRPDLVHVTACDILSASVLGVVKEAGLPLVLSLTDFWFLCPRINLLHSNGEICTGMTTPWECLRCKLYKEKAYRWPRELLPERVVSRVLTEASQYPLLTRRRGLRGMAGDMADRKAYLGQAIRLPDVRITASHFVRDVFVANGVDAEIRVAPYGHDLAWMKDYAGKTPSKFLRIGFIGQIGASKGVHLLLLAVRFLQDEYRDKVSLSVYGNMEHDPEYSAGLYKQAAELQNIQFCGTYTRDESAQVYANIDVLVVPSLWYDFPLVIHEAFASRTPVIATNLGGMAEAVTHNVSGLLFERGNADDLAKQMKRFVDEPNLPEHLSSGIPRVKTIHEEVLELETMYEQLIQKNHVPNSV